MSSPVLRAAFGAFVALLRRPHRRSLQVTLDNAVSVRRAQRLYIRLDQRRSNWAAFRASTCTCTPQRPPPQNFCNYSLNLRLTNSCDTINRWKQFQSKRSLAFVFVNCVLFGLSLLYQECELWNAESVSDAKRSDLYKENPRHFVAASGFLRGLLSKSGKQKPLCTDKIWLRG